MAKKGGAQTVTQQLDPASQAYQKRIRDVAGQISQQPYTPYGGQTVAGVSTLSPEAVAQAQRAGSAFGDVAGLGGLGAAALGGNRAAFTQFNNPFQSGVLDALAGDYDVLRNKATLSANDAAIQAGAFGGSRHGVMLGEQLGQIDRAQGDQMANLRYGGFNDAMNRAATATNLGMGAASSLGANAGLLFGMGDYFRNIQQQGLTDAQNRFLEGRDWNLRNLGVLQQGMGQPGAQTTTPYNRNVGAGALGGALTGAEIGSMIPGLGTGIGAGVGGLLGLLG